MSKSIKPFAGFSKGLFYFMQELSVNNSIDWFHNNKDRYQEYLVQPAKAFVSEIAPFLNRINPSIRTEPKFNQTIMRLNKDMRFAKGEPYRTYFLLHFGRFKMDSEYFVYFDQNEIQIGLFLNKSKHENIFFRENLKKNRSSIINVFEKYRLNGKYSLYKLDKEPVKVLSKFYALKHMNRLNDIDYILIQKVNKPTESKIYSPDFVIEAVKIFSSLYPLYAFSISRDPLTEIEKFEDNFGAIV